MEASGCGLACCPNQTHHAVSRFLYPARPNRRESSLRGEGRVVLAKLRLPYEEDAKGKLMVTQSIPKERFAAGENGPALGYWGEIGASKPAQSGKGAFVLSKYKQRPKETEGQSTEEPRGSSQLGF